MTDAGTRTGRADIERRLIWDPQSIVPAVVVADVSETDISGPGGRLTLRAVAWTVAGKLLGRTFPRLPTLAQRLHDGFRHLSRPYGQ